MKHCVFTGEGEKCRNGLGERRKICVAALVKCRYKKRGSGLRHYPLPYSMFFLSEILHAMLLEDGFDGKKVHAGLGIPPGAVE